MKALVTGAAGFIGAHVVRALVEAGHEVRAFHLPTDDLRGLRGLDVEKVAGDVTDRASVRAAVRGVGWVFHLAAIYALWTKDPWRMRRVNVHGTRIVLEEAARAGVQRTVHTSSIARFGGQGLERRATEESAFALGVTGDLYSRTKAEAHEIARGAARRGEPVVIVAPCGPIGPGDVGPTPTGRLLLSAITLPAAVVTRSATCFADVRDMARAHVLAAEKGDVGETYLLGAQDLTMAELVGIAHRVSGVRRPILSVPYALAGGAAHVASAIARRTGKAPLFTPAAVRISRLGLRADCTKAVHRLGMEQSPIERAVADALRWFAMEGFIADRRLTRAILESPFRATPFEQTSAPSATALS
jgi:dihydroflavonol-4-reductase